MKNDKTKERKEHPMQREEQLGRKWHGVFNKLLIFILVWLTVQRCFFENKDKLVGRNNINCLGKQ